MKKINLGQAVATLANVGVLVGILLLVFELNQNRQITQAQMRESLAQLDIEMMQSLREDDDLMRLTVQQLPDVDTVDDLRIWLWVRESLRQAEEVFYQHRVGTLNDSEFQGARTTWKNRFSSPEYRDLWDRYKTEFSPEFVEEFDRVLRED